MNEGPRYAIYFVPAAESPLYRFGSSVLGYDCYTGETSPYPDELMSEPRTWGRMVEEPRRYGFHATLKAPFHLASGCTERQLIDAVESFAASGHAIPVIAPVIGMLSGFAAILPKQPEPTLDALAERCTSVFDSFRAPMSPQERAQRIAAGLNQAQIANVDRWGYPFVFAEFLFHMSLTGRLAAEARGCIVALLRRSFERLCGDETIAIDRLGLVKQDSPQTNFGILRQIRLRAARR